jgi:hypothetical protein
MRKVKMGSSSQRFSQTMGPYHKIFRKRRGWALPRNNFSQTMGPPSNNFSQTGIVEYYWE